MEEVSLYMPLGIVSESDFLKESSVSIPSSDIEKPSEEINPSLEINPSSEINQEEKQDEPLEPSAEVLEMKRLGRVPGTKEVPDFLRKIIGESNIVDGRANTLLAFGKMVSPSSINAYANGATSCATYNEKAEGLGEHIDNVKNDIKAKAQAKVIRALDEITGEKLQNTKARELAGIAKDLSAVVKNMEPEKGDGDRPNVQIVYYTPPPKEEKEYRTITVQE